MYTYVILTLSVSDLFGLRDEPGAQSRRRGREDPPGSRIKGRTARPHPQ